MSRSIGVVTNMLHYNLVESKFKFYSHFYIHLQFFILWKGKNLFIQPTWG